MASCLIARFCRADERSALESLVMLICGTSLEGEIDRTSGSSVVTAPSVMERQRSQMNIDFERTSSA